MVSVADDKVMATRDAATTAHPFDLNIEQVLEHWPVAFAIRELIANALDEQALSGTGDPVVSVDAEGNWHIRDFGRGLSYLHLTQNENPEKRNHPDVVGQFGIGLKDALAVCDRHDIRVTLRSAHGDITTETRAKAGFADISTLHGLVATPSDPGLNGTEVTLAGVSAGDIALAKSYFLRFSGDELLDSTAGGQVLAKSSPTSAGRIYVKGLLVAEEPDFLFSYNITKLNAPLKRALNRERSNVGRTAYSDRIKTILIESRSPKVVDPLVKDLEGSTTGAAHDEVAWKDVAIHACRVLQSLRKVVFVSPWQTGSASVAYARGDGHDVVVVPDDIAAALHDRTDIDGKPMLNLERYSEDWNENFTFDFVDPSSLTVDEAGTYALTQRVIELAGVDLAGAGITEVLISETMRLADGGAHQIVGLCDRDAGRIVIRRDQMANRAQWIGVLLHELAHAVSGSADGTLEFEDALTTRMGIAVDAAMAEFGAQST